MNRRYSGLFFGVICCAIDTTDELSKPPDKEKIGFFATLSRLLTALLNRWIYSSLVGLLLLLISSIVNDANCSVCIFLSSKRTIVAGGTCLIFRNGESELFVSKTIVRGSCCFKKL